MSDQLYKINLMNENARVITEEQALAVMNFLGSPEPPKFIQISDEMYAVHQITGIVKTEAPLSIGAGEKHVMLSIGSGREKCKWCEKEWTGAWSQHASICVNNPYRKEAGKLLDKVTM